MTGDPIPAALDQLAAHREQIEQLDQRQAGQHAAINQRLTEIADLVTGIRGTLQDHHTVLAKLTGLDRQLNEAGTSADDAESGAGDGGYQPAPAPRWWQLTPAERQEPAARLRAWVEQVYRPGYGQLAAALGPCWESHDLCLYALDLLAELWSVLYLTGKRTPALLTAQAEYQARLLPALAAQLQAETSRCGHPKAPSPNGHPRSLP